MDYNGEAGFMAKLLKNGVSEETKADYVYADRQAMFGNRFPGGWTSDKPAKVDNEYIANLKKVRAGEMVLNPLHLYRMGTDDGPQDYLKHEELYRAYPELKTTFMKLKKLDPNVLGSSIADTEGNHLGINMSNKLSGADFKNTALHEIQHAIQEIDKRLDPDDMGLTNFNRNQNMWESSYYGDAGPSEEMKGVKERLRNYQAIIERLEYTRSPHEVEARVTGKELYKPGMLKANVLRQEKRDGSKYWIDKYRRNRSDPKYTKDLDYIVDKYEKIININADNPGEAEVIDRYTQFMKALEQDQWNGFDD